MRFHSQRDTAARAIALSAGMLILFAGAPEALAQSKKTPRPATPQRDTDRQVRRGAAQQAEPDFQDRLRTLRDEQRQAMMRKQAGEPGMDEELARIRNQISRISSAQGQFGSAAGNSRAGRPVSLQPGVDGSESETAIGMTGIAGALRGELVGEDGFIELAFPGGSLALDEFVKWVQMVLDINIISQEEIRSKEVLFFAPLRIETDQLLALLSALLEKEGYALVKNELGWYDIIQSINLPPIFESELITTQVIPTPLLLPSRLLQTINEALGQTSNQMRLSAIDDLGLLLVTGSPNRVRSVSKFVERYFLERDKIELHTFQFEDVSAEYGRSRMLALNEQLAAPGARGEQPGIGGAGVSNLSQNLILDQGNRIIFRGRPDEWALVSDLAERVDVITSLRPKRHVVGSIAEQIANAGQDLGLGSVRQTGGSNLFGGRGGGFNPSGRGGRTQGQDNTEQALASGFVLDLDAGALTYFGTESQHVQIDALVKQYRQYTNNNQRTVEVYKLQHLIAEEVASLLDAILQDPQAQNQFRGSPFIPGQRNRTNQQRTPDVIADAEDGDVGAAGDGDSFVTVTADQVTITFEASQNTILVNASPRNQREIARIIDQIDERLPQVLIEAQIVSVTVNEDFSFSADVDLSAGQFEFLSTFGVTAPGTLLTDNVTLPGSSIGSGLTTGLFRSDFVPIAIQALETVGDAKLVSNPRILVNDNTDAEVLSNEERPFSSTTQGTATTVTSQGGTAEAGTTLSVTPRISAGGYLVLEYSVELSAFIGAGQGGLQPPRQTENYSSVVTIPSDSTIIVGGFVSTSDSKDESKVPLLGDIPIIGNLFKSVTTRKVKRMIFVFITPKILDDPNFRDLRLATEGPLKDVELEGIVPNLKPAVIPITQALAARGRNVPESVLRSDLLLRTQDILIEPTNDPGE